MDKKRIIQNKTDVAVATPTKNKLSELKELVNRFSDNIEQYKNPNYKEARTRVDFIDKFFELLDWDLSNKQGFSEAYRDVIREDEVRIEGKHKAPDYCFKIGVERKFFVEAKKPSVNIKDDIGAAYQLRRYAYSAKLPLSILTDFHELAVYDTRIKPRPKDNASVARIFYCQFDEYEKNFDFIYNTFSKNAILKGSFDRYVADNKKKKGTSEVDKEFLKLIESWRSELAKNIAVNNKKLDLFNLNTAVQKIIDRLIFLRIAEARNIEEYDNLSKIAESGNVYKKLDEYFQRSDKRYNSGLFKIETWLSDLKIEDNILKDIIKSTYFPESPYEFSVLPVEILGNIYEQFLGKVIHLTATHQAKIEEKPEVKKAGGVYYTPQYIVDYIVKNTVGEKLKDSSPEKVEKIKICDPACGSGSFLLGAYAYLLRWHLDYYTKDKKSLEKYKKAGKIYDYKGNFKLTIDEKKKVLKNNIFGVDIDSQAVEVTKLSLLLKLMEDETQQSAGMLIKYSKEALLPDLKDNIKCGNSLIGTDFYGSKNMSLFGNDEIRKVNAFDWEKEFKDIFDGGGFDVVIGNPPYIRINFLEDELKGYFSKKYKSAMKLYDIYVLFVEKAISLLKNTGELGFIVSNKFLISDYGLGIREIILNSTNIRQIIDVSYDNVFKNASVYPIITIFERQDNKQKRIENKIGYCADFSDISNPRFEYVEQKEFLDSQNHNLDFSSIGNGWIKKLYIDSLTLGEITNITRGFRPPSAELTESKAAREKYLIGRDLIGSYLFDWGGRVVDYKPDQIPESKPLEIFKKNKIIFRDIGLKLNASLDKNGYLCLKTIYFLYLKEKYEEYPLEYILGILNSKLVDKFFYLKFSIAHISGGYLRFRKQFVEQIPIKLIKNNKEKLLSNSIISSVNLMIDTRKKFYSAKTEADKNLYQQKIEILDKQIDAEVYKLYGLTAEEVKIVEGEINI